MNDDDETRELRAGMSMCFGIGIPAPLLEFAQSQGLHAGGWAYPRVLGTDEHSMTVPRMRHVDRRMLADADRAGIALLVPGDPGWPTNGGCAELPCLWVRGNTDITRLLRRAVTVTGTQDVSDKGMLLAANLAAALARAGLTIATSTGRGVDTHVVRAVLAVADAAPVLLSRTGLAVPPGPAVQAAPPQVLERGAIISAVPPKWQVAAQSLTRAHHELLHRLAARTVLVEAQAGSGHLNAARNATNSGHLVCAVPAEAGSPHAAGCHELIHDGTAHSITTSDQVLALLADHDRPDSDFDA